MQAYGGISNYFPKPLIQEIFVQNSAVNNDAEYVSIGLIYLRFRNYYKISSSESKGSSMNITLLRFIDNCSLNYKEIRSKYLTIKEYKFTSKRKRTSIIIALEDPKKARILLRGVSELVLESCSKIHKLDDEIIEITPEIKNTISEKIEEMASRGLRTVIMAYKDFDIDSQSIIKIK